MINTDEFGCPIKHISFNCSLKDLLAVPVTIRSHLSAFLFKEAAVGFRQLLRPLIADSILNC